MDGPLCCETLPIDWWNDTEAEAMARASFLKYVAQRSSEVLKQVPLLLNAPEKQQPKVVVQAKHELATGTKRYRKPKTTTSYPDFDPDILYNEDGEQICTFEELGQEAPRKRARRQILTYEELGGRGERARERCSTTEVNLLVL